MFNHCNALHGKIQKWWILAHLEKKDKRSDDHHNTKALASNVSDKTVLYWKMFANFVT